MKLIRLEILVSSYKGRDLDLKPIETCPAIANGQRIRDRPEAG